MYRRKKIHPRTGMYRAFIFGFQIKVYIYQAKAKDIGVVWLSINVLDIMSLQHFLTFIPEPVWTASIFGFQINVNIRWNQVQAKAIGVVW